MISSEFVIFEGSFILGKPINFPIETMGPSNEAIAARSLTRPNLNLTCFFPTVCGTTGVAVGSFGELFVASPPSLVETT